ncbi:hypothetical protein ACWEBX_36125, partial [Streptomyces sp. NPDC005070]
MRTARRIQVVAGASAALAAWTATALLTRVPVLLVALPVVGALWLLVLLDGGYLLGREWAHRRRRRASGPQRTAWSPEPGVRKPIDYPNIVPRPAGDSAVDRQGRFRATGIRLAVLPALAVVFLTVQTVFFDHDSDLGLGFVLAECLLLVFMV